MISRYMGSYCQYKLGGWEIESSQSYIFPALTEPFHLVLEVKGGDEELTYTSEKKRLK